MTEKPARVIAVDEQGILIKIQPDIVACTFCAGSCFLNGFSKPGDNQDNSVYIQKNRIQRNDNQSGFDIRAGDKIFLGIKNNWLLTASIIVYLLPLLFFLITIQTTKIIFDNELLITFAGFIGLLIGFSALKLFDHIRYFHNWSITLRRSADIMATSPVNSN